MLPPIPKTVIHTVERIKELEDWRERKIKVYYIRKVNVSKPSENNIRKRSFSMENNSYREWIEKTK